VQAEPGDCLTLTPLHDSERVASMATKLARKPSRASIRGAAILQELLTELAFALLPRGMTPKRFNELARCAFVRAAADMSRPSKGRVNYSRVAAQTGLTRADVKRSLKYNFFASPSLGQTPLEKVIDGWRTDRRFGKNGRPKRLKISGSNGSFAYLVRKYGGDVPHRAVLDELRRIDVVTNDGSRVRLQSPLHLRRRHDFEFLSPVLPALVDGLRIASSRAGLRASSSIHRLSLPVETEVDLTLVRDRCVSSAKSMLDGLGHSLGRQVTLPSRGKTPAYSFTITVLLAENQAKRPQRAR
jgi:Family of unknown function (DUF6502)